MKTKLIVTNLVIILVLFLTGCVRYIDITGRVVNQQGKGIQGIIISCGGKVAETDVSGRFTIGTPEPDYSKEVTITIDGQHLGFGRLTKTVTVFKSRNTDMGAIQFTREKALVYGTITLPTLTTASTELLSAPAEFPTYSNRPYAEGEVIVKFKNGITTQSVDMLSKDLQAEVMSVAPKSQITVLKTAKDTFSAIEVLKNRADVEYAEPNYYVYPLSTTTPLLVSYCNDPYYPQQWNMQAINIENAWKNGYTGSDRVIVAVLDTGIKKGIPELDNRILWELGTDIVDNDNDPSVIWNSHGTQVASIIGAIPDNNTGIAGINHSITIVPVRILRETNNDGYWGKTSELLQGLEYAIYQADADIINLSVAINISSSDSKSVNEMIDLAEQEGTLIIAAAGNNGGSSPTYPASNPKVLSVAAVGPTLQPASYTNKGANIYAPGGDYYLYPVSNSNMIRVIGSGVEWAQGTSIASAHVAGIAALIKAGSPSMLPQILRNRLINTSLDLAYSDGAGLVDAYRAVTGKPHARIFIFYGHEDYSQLFYKPEESTYTYPRNGANFYQISTITPDPICKLYAWVDTDADGKLSYGDLYDTRSLSLRKGDEMEVNLILSRFGN